MNKQPKSWYYFIVDNDQKRFSVTGLISSEQALNEAVLTAQASGRDIRSQSCLTEDEMKRDIAHWKTKGFQQVQAAIVNMPADTSAEYKDPLPDYAKEADRSKVVKLLCGRCNVTCFAEMSVTYPGQEVLHKGDLGAYEAKCLKCGSRAIDPYNWSR
jgi:hypothetical protein